MADVNPQPTIQAPTDVAARAKSAAPAIFVMPPEYRYGAVGKKMAEPVKPAPPPSSVPVAPKPLPPKAPVPSGKIPPKKKSPMRFFLIGGVMFVLLLAAGGGGLVWWSNQSATVTPTTPSTPGTRPVETPTPIETPTTTPTPVETPTTSPFPTSIVPGKDTDSDGVTDIEETMVYSTDPRLPDSDSDGFLDGNEVYHRYNPIGTAPGTLLEAGLVKLLDQSSVPAESPVVLLYSILYPAIWKAEFDPTNPRNVVFMATTGETITFTVEAKDAPDQTVEDWFRAHNPDDTFVTSQTKNGYPLLTSEDKLTDYIGDGDEVFVLSYHSGLKGTVDYLQTFQMMVNSVVLTN